MPNSNEQKWAVVRIDDHGNEFLMYDRLDRQTAIDRVLKLERLGHKQAYFITHSPHDNE